MEQKVDPIDNVEDSPAHKVNETLKRDAPGGRYADVALEFTLNSRDVTWTEDEERKVRWKIDSVVLPLLFFGSVVGCADTQAYGFAALFGLVKDLNLYEVVIVNGVVTLDTWKYSWSAALSPLGSVVSQYPLLILAQYVSYGRFLGVTITYTGVLVLLILVCHDFASIAALKFFLGFGVVVQPVSIIISAIWWKTNEQPLRIGLFLAGAAIGQLVGQGIDFGAVSIGGVYAASPWKWIYVILGSITVGYGIISALLFSSSPMTAWFLNSKERIIATKRLLGNNTGMQAKSFKSQQVFEFLRDPQIYLLGIYSFSFAFVNNAIGSFGGFLVSSFGYDQNRSLLLAMPIGGVAIICMVGSGVLGWLFPRQRILIAMLFIFPSIIGNAILWKIDGSNIHGLLAGLYISATFYGALVQEFALLAANVAGNTKKTCLNAAIVVLANLGGFSGPFAYHGNQAAQRYPTGQISALSLLCASEAAFCLLWFYYARQNAKKSSLRREHPEMISDPTIAFADMTDQENPIFQYAC